MDCAPLETPLRTHVLRGLQPSGPRLAKPPFGGCEAHIPYPLEGDEWGASHAGCDILILLIA